MGGSTHTANSTFRSKSLQVVTWLPVLAQEWKPRREELRAAPGLPGEPTTSKEAGSNDESARNEGDRGP